MALLKVSLPPAIVKPPVPLITPEYVPLALLKLKVFAPKVVLPAPLKLTTLMPPLAPLIVNVPALATALLAIVPAPLNAKVAPLLIVVVPE